MLPISSRNSVPPLAASKRPLRILSAPVNAPASWPNSSSSSRFSLSAVQFIGRDGLFFWGGLFWVGRGAGGFSGAGLPEIKEVAVGLGGGGQGRGAAGRSRG